MGGISRYPACHGTPVRDRQARLLDLFTKPKPIALAQAQRILAEGARFNIDPPGVTLIARSTCL